MSRFKGSVEWFYRKTQKLFAFGGTKVGELMFEDKQSRESTKGFPKTPHEIQLMGTSEGLAKIIHISDLHFGRENSEKILALKAKIETIRPHLAVISGDTVDKPTEFQRTILPAATRLQNMDDPADDPPVVLAFRSRLLLGKRLFNKTKGSDLVLCLSMSYTPPHGPPPTHRISRRALPRYRPGECPAGYLLR